MTELLGGILFIAMIFGGVGSYKLLRKCVPQFKPKHCRGCGFPLIGIDALAVCPECGQKRDWVPPPRNPWTAFITGALWGVVGVATAIGMLTWQLGPFVQPLFIAVLIPAIAVPCVVSFWIAARGSLIVAYAAGFGMTLVLAGLSFAIARSLRQDALAVIGACMGSVIFPMVMGWGCWVPFAVHSLRSRP
ncbi:MAG: hypothetical protein JNM86_10865 [Phycisphaerae bacterium]|nr:hypothetical protein [Phycisphaerae bacterium]